MYHCPLLVPGLLEWTACLLVVELQVKVQFLEELGSVAAVCIQVHIHTVEEILYPED